MAQNQRENVKQIAIYGVGLYGRLFKAALDANQGGVGNLVGFIDQFSPLAAVEDVPVKRIDSVENKEGICVYISVALNADRNEAGECLGTHIRQQLIIAGIREFYDFADAIKKISAVQSRFPEQKLLWMHDVFPAW
jgi:hypothetical protein